MRKSIFFIGLLTAYAAEGSGVWHDPPLAVRTGSHALDTIVGTPVYVNINVRAAADASHPVEWGVKCGDCTAALRLPKLDRHSDLYSTDATVVLSKGREILKTVVLSSGIDTDGRFNTIKLVYDGTGRMRVYAGDDMQMEVGELPAPDDGDAVAVFSDAQINLQREDAVWQAGLPRPASTHLDSLRPRMTEKDGVTGIWAYLDRELDTRKASLPAKYSLAVVPGHNGEGYEIYALDKTSGVAELKGSLHPTIFEGNFDLEWITADYRRYVDDTYAQLSSDATVLTLRFPAIGSQLRFSRLSVR